MNTTMENPVLEATQVQSLTFIERMIEGLTPTKISDTRTIYVGSDGLRLEVVNGRLYNRGMLKPGWVLRSDQEGKYRVHSVSPSRAVVTFGNTETITNNNHTGISATSECEILDPEEKSVPHITEGKEETHWKINSVNIPTKSNTAKYQFDGAEYGKSPLARAIVAKYVNDNPKVTIKKLDEVFPAEIMGRLGVFKELSEAKKLSGSGQPRYFFKDEQLVKTVNFTIAVCNQFTTEKIDALIEVATKLGYAITK